MTRPHRVALRPRARCQCGRGRPVCAACDAHAQHVHRHGLVLLWWRGQSVSTDYPVRSILDVQRLRRQGLTLAAIATQLHLGIRTVQQFAEIKVERLEDRP